MKQKRHVFIFTLLFISMITLFSFRSYAYEIVKTPYPNSIDSSALTGNPREDILTIAKSQLGYKEAQSSSGAKYTFYAEWCDTNASNWCSEFAYWCGYMTGMPDSLFPVCTDVYDYLEAYGKLGRIYDLEGGNENGKEWIKSKGNNDYYTKTITLAEVEPGDILLVRGSLSVDDASEPCHTCIARKIDLEDGKIYTYDGNKGSGSLKGVCKKSYTLSHIYAVIKPMYELYPLTGIKLVADDNGLTISWDKREGVDGYNIYRSASDGEDELTLCKKIESNETTVYTDQTVEKDKIYYYRVVPYITSASGQVYDGKGFTLSSYGSDTGAAVLGSCKHRYLPKETQDGTCKKLNKVTYTCIYCNDSYQAREQYSPHNYKRSIYRSASVSSPGKYKYKCSVCGTSYKKTFYASNFTIDGIKYHRTSSSKVEVTGASHKSSVTSITIPKTVKYNGKTYKVKKIASKAFKNYKKLKKVKIKAELTEIESYAFYKCESLKEIKFTKITAPEFGKKVLSKTSSKLKIYVPSSAVSVYELKLAVCNASEKLTVKASD